MMASASTLLLGIGGGVVAELLLFLLLRRLFRLDGTTAAVAVALLALLVYLPYAVLTWPGIDVVAIHLAVFLTVAYALGVVGGRMGRRWHWVPASIVAFFVVVITTNVVFLGVAEQGISGLFARLLPEPRGGEVVDSRFPGTVSHDFQEKESLYNAYLRQVEVQHERGWQVRKGWLARPVVGEPAVFIVAVEDRAGRAVAGATVTGRFLRSSSSREDFDVTLAEVAPGEYRTTVEMPLHGLWRLVLQVRRGEAVHEVRAETSVLDARETG